MIFPLTVFSVFLTNFFVNFLEMFAFCRMKSLIPYSCFGKLNFILLERGSL